MLFNFCQASYEVLEAAMRGVIVVEVDAKIALSMSLSWRTQWFMIEADEEVPSEIGHTDFPVT